MPSTERAKVIFDATSLRYLHTGLGQVSYQLLTEFAKVSELPFDIFALVHPENKTLVPRGINIEHANWLRRHGPGIIKKHLFGSPRLWHIVNENTRMTAIPNSARVLLTIHGLHELDEVSSKTPVHLAAMQKLVDRADMITVDSHYTEKVVRERLDIKDKRMTVLYLGTAFSDALPIAPAWAPDGKFIYTIGTFFKRKNLHVLLPMMKHLPDLKLVMAGNYRQAYGDFVMAELDRLGLHDKVITPGEISEGEKAWLFREGQALLIPSLTEGFGIPVLEACYYGQRVICSGNGSLPEIGLHHAAYWNTFEPGHMADVVREQLESDTEGKKSARRAYALEFSWRKTAFAFLDLYKEWIR